MFINGISSISPQEPGIINGSPVREYQTDILKAIPEDYKSYIKPMLLRRMASAVKMGVYCANEVLTEAGISQPDAILVGTGQGCQQDTNTFLENMLQAEEELLSPTSFIQSTHNTVGGQIALQLECKAYNMTFTQNAVSFESALIDAGLLFTEDKESRNMLVGAVDEISEKFTGFERLDGQLKKEPVTNLDLLESGTEGTITSESSSFFILSNERSDGSYAELLDCSIFNDLAPDEVETRISEFLNENDLEVSEIDLIILGSNGDIRYDEYYSILRNGIFSKTSQIVYKHLVGDNNSISGYAFWLASNFLKNKSIPDIFKLNEIKPGKIEKVLIYNQYLGRNHGLILLQEA